VSHEINNPLGVAKSGIDTERRALEKIEAELPEESETGQRALKAAKSMLSTIAAALDRIEATENSLRTFAHLDEAEFQKVRLDEELRTVISLLPPELDVRGRLDLQHAPGLPELYVNAREVNQMFMTLLRSAFEALPERSGLVAISSRLEEDTVLIEISDNGEGMDEETQRALFDVTLRSHGSRVAAGFDLPAAQAIAQRHGGYITVDSKLGQGSTVTVRLPTRAKPERA
jgi:signal transduction histidine kinase